jgi:hypothetical protein
MFAGIVAAAAIVVSFVILTWDVAVTSAGVVSKTSCGTALSSKV